MKRKTRKKNPEWEINELILYAENTEPLYNQYRYIMRNLSRKYKKGIYDQKKAAILWKHWIDEAVKSYNVEILGGRRSLVQNVFTVADRKKAAVLMEAQERGDVASGEFLVIDNPKGKRKMAKKKRSAKQLANDRRLGRMAKARAKKKRGGRRKKVAKRKVTKRRVVRKRNVVRRGVPKTIAKKKSGLWLLFKCNGRTIQFFFVSAAPNNWTGDKGKAILFKTKEQAAKVGRHYAKKAGYKRYSIGVAPSNLATQTILADCKQQMFLGGKA